MTMELDPKEEIKYFVDINDLKKLFDELAKLPKKHLLIEIAQTTISTGREPPEIVMNMLAYIFDCGAKEIDDALETVNEVFERWSTYEKPEGVGFINGKEWNNGDQTSET